MCETYIECWWPHIENLEHWNLEIRKTRKDFSVQVLLLPLSLKVLRHKERDTIFLCWLFHLAPVSRKFVSPLRARESQPSRLASSFSSSNFLRNPQNPSRTSGAWRHSHSVTLFLISSYCDISEWQVRSARARVNTCIKFAPN